MKRYFLKAVILFLNISVLCYVILCWMMEIFKLIYISLINLQIFCLLLSLSISFCVLLNLLPIITKTTFRIKVSEKCLPWNITLSLLPLLLGIILLAKFDRYFQYGFMAFQQWNLLSMLDITLTVIMYCYLLFGLPYIIDKLLFRFHFSNSEKVVFYPVLSMLFLGFIGFFLPSFQNIWFLKFIMPILIGGFLMFTPNRKYKDYPIILNLNLTEIFGLVLIVIFRLFIYYSSIGKGIFLRQDIAYQAEYIARINRYGFLGYLNAPSTERYPIFYLLAWSSISKILPLPYCNVLIIATFFNHILITISFYILAKKLLKTPRESLFSTFAFTILSGFSWFYLLTNPPTGQLSAVELYNYVRKMHERFGMYSGSTVSFIYADCHGLIRLWSLNVYFVSLISLISCYLDGDYLKRYLTVFSASFLQIALGHTPEIILLAFSLFTLTFLSHSIEIHGKIIKLILFLTFSIIPFMLWLKYPYQCLITILIPLSMFLIALSLKRIYHKTINKHISSLLKRNIIYTACIILIWHYIIALIAFLTKYNSVSIRYPIFTLWYSPPIQWGFPGLLFISTLMKSVLVRKNMEFGFSFNLLMFTLLGILITLINCVNLYYYIGLPYPFMPIYFLPFFALTSGYLIKHEECKRVEMNYHLKRVSLTIIIIAFFILGSSCHIISASYWRNNSWWRERPGRASLSSEEIQLLNSLYAIPRQGFYEEACFIPKDQPYPPIEGIKYQSVRYRMDSEKHIIRLSGFTPSSRLVESALYDAKSLDEVYFLVNNFSSTRIIVVDRGTKSSIIQLINKEPIFEGGKYNIYILPITLSKTFKEGVLIERMEFSGNLTLMSREGETLKNVEGEILPLNKGYVLINVKNKGTFIIPHSNLKFEGTVTFFNVKATRLYFPEALCCAQKITFHGNISFKILNSFDGKRLYLISLNYTDPYEVYPKPWHMNPKTGKNLIHQYIKINKIPISYVMTNPIGIAWSLAMAVAILIIWRQNQHIVGRIH